VNAHNIPNQFLEISSPDGRWHAQIAQQAASLWTLSLNGELLVEPPLIYPFVTTAGVTMAPWPNRLRDGVYELNGKRYQAPINEERTNNALHGLVMERHFNVSLHTETELRLHAAVGDDIAYPAGLEVGVNYELTNNGLLATISGTNVSANGESVGPIPFGTGPHPYFVTKPGSTLSVKSTFSHQLDERQLPVGEQAPDLKGLPSGVPVQLRNLSIDDCFGGLSIEEDGLAHTHLTRPDLELNLDIWQEREYGYLMVFNLQPEGSEDGFLALEPQTCPANAFNSGEDLIWLEPGQSWSASWGVRAQAIVTGGAK
jgi:aldose 1-epimerase